MIELIASLINTTRLAAWESLFYKEEEHDLELPMRCQVMTPEVMTQVVLVWSCFHIMDES